MGLHTTSHLRSKKINKRVFEHPNEYLIVVYCNSLFFICCYTTLGLPFDNQRTNWLLCLWTNQQNSCWTDPAGQVHGEKSNDWEGGGGSPEFIGITLSARLDLKGGPWIPNEGARPPLHPITQFPPTPPLNQNDQLGHLINFAHLFLLSFVWRWGRTRMCTNCNSCSTNLNKHKSSLTQADTEWRTLWRAPVSCM